MKNIIKIEELQKKQILLELIRLKNKYISDDNTRCIFYAPYTELVRLNNVLEITVVQEVIDIEEEKLIEAINKKYDKMDLGVKLFIDTDESIHYIAPNIIRCSNLHHSEILFDKDGRYTSIKQRGKYVKYDNLAYLEPKINSKDVKKT